MIRFDLQDMTEDLESRLARATLEDQETLFPRPETPPSRTVVKRRSDAISTLEHADRFENTLVDRVAAPTLRTRRFSAQSDPASEAARQILDQRRGLGRCSGRRSHCDHSQVQNST